jgi:hypothetical protein
MDRRIANLGFGGFAQRERRSGMDRRIRERRITH